MNRRLWVVCSLVMGLACLLGCGGGVKTGTVYGSVALDGKPLAEGTISFHPLDGNTPTTGGKVTGGKYSVAVPRGTQKVLISAYRVTGQRKAYENDPNSKMVDITEPIVPIKYTNPFETPLSIDVNAGSVKQDFNISSMP